MKLTTCRICNKTCSSHAFPRAHYISRHKNSCAGTGVFPNYRIHFAYSRIRPRMCKTNFAYNKIERHRLLMKRSTTLPYKEPNLKGYMDYLSFNGPDINKKMYEHSNMSHFDIKLYSRYKLSHNLSVKMKLALAVSIIAMGILELLRKILSWNRAKKSFSNRHCNSQI